MKKLIICCLFLFTCSHAFSKSNESSKTSVDLSGASEEQKQAYKITQKKISEIKTEAESNDCLAEIKKVCPKTISQSECLQKYSRGFSSRCKNKFKEFDKFGATAAAKCQNDFIKLCNMDPEKAIKDPMAMIKNVTDCMSEKIDQLGPECKDFIFKGQAVDMNFLKENLKKFNNQKEIQVVPKGN